MSDAVDLTYGEGLKISPTQPVYDGSSQLPVSRTYRLTGPAWVEAFVWASVISSNVVSIAYNKKSKRLFVMFNGGSVYIYSEVDSGTARDMFNCSSMGKFVHYRLKGKYPYRKVAGSRESEWPGLGVTANPED